MSIGADTPIVPEIIAETVVRELAVYLREQLPEQYAPYLVARAERHYADNDFFRRRVLSKRDGGNAGRD